METIEAGKPTSYSMSYCLAVLPKQEGGGGFGFFFGGVRVVQLYQPNL